MTDSEKLKVVTVLELANVLADWVDQSPYPKPYLVASPLLMLLNSPVLLQSTTHLLE